MEPIIIMRSKLTQTAALVLACLPALAMAHGNYSCKEPTAQWQHRDALEDKLKSEGWKVTRIKIDKGCYEVYGFDDKGKRAEAYFNPRTFEKLGDVEEDNAKSGK